MDFSVSPDPDPEDREAVTIALERLLGGEHVPPAFRSAWRHEGVVENLGVDYATARPRSNPGATRA